MSKVWRALTVSAVVGGLFAEGWYLVHRWIASAEQVGEVFSGIHLRPTRESLVESLPDDQKKRLLQELGEQI